MYDALGVGHGATKEEIKRMYKRLAMRHHPDKEGGDADRFKDISEAYAVLSDDDRRRRYDEVGDQGWSAGGGVTASPPPSHADLMAHMFAGMAGMGGVSRSKSRGDHLHTLRVSLREAFHGVKKTLRVRVQHPCPTCLVRPCEACEGSGKVQQVHAMGMMRHIMIGACAACGGSGDQPRPAHLHPCDPCSTSTEHVLSMDVPAGAHTGHRECFKGLGDQATRLGDTAGDLVVEVCVAEDPVFTRQGDDLHMTVSISLSESILGKAILVPMFGGDLTFDTRQIGTGIMQPGRRYALPGHGMPMSCGPSGVRGGLVITFVVTYPTDKLSTEQHARLKRAFHD